MLEKDALSGVLVPVCGVLDVGFTANKGYLSSSTMYEIGQRLKLKAGEGKQIQVIYQGDHAPSGIDMGRTLKRRTHCVICSREALVLFSHSSSADRLAWCCQNSRRNIMNSPLPAGKECYDCNHVGRFAFNSNTRPSNKVCAFAPSQFEQNPGLLPGAQIWNARDENDQNQGESS